VTRGWRVMRLEGALLGPAADARLFFCQAEDGIRDDLVTGVQTCALPICPTRRSLRMGPPRRARRRAHPGLPALVTTVSRAARVVSPECRTDRSEASSRRSTRVTARRRALRARA